MTFYHNKKVYGTKRAALGSNISMPKINYYDNPFTPTGIVPSWIDEDGNKFAQNESVRIASSTANYNQLKASGVKVTKSSKFRSVVVKAIAERIEYVISSKLVFPTNKTINALKGYPVTETISYPTTITIIDMDGNTGLGDDNGGVKINGKYVALPYSYHHPENTSITFVNGNYKYTYTGAPVVSRSFRKKPSSTSFFVPHVIATASGKSTDGEYAKNPNVGVYLDSTRIKAPTIGSPNKITLSAQSVYNTHTDGSRVGIDYNLWLDEYRVNLPIPTSEYVTLYGDTDSVFNAYVCEARGSHNII